jgi:hypothetical protein
MKEIKEYLVISASNLETLNKTVNEYIDDGWQPYENFVAVFKHNNPGTSPSGNMYFYQPIVKG